MENGAGIFASQIRPILAARCYQCHGPDLQQNGLRLDSLAAILKGSANGSVVIPGDSEKSPLVRRILGLDRPQMPYGGPPLSADDVELIRKWIDQGARGPDSTAPLAAAKPVKHWAYVKPVRPDVPKVKDAAWCRNPIDNFVLARLETEGLKPSPEASKEMLIRRVSLALIGLPPTPEEVDAFLADHSPQAYEKVVDRLLASPHFGERWAAAWLDLARYADTNGYEKDLRRTMWKYRDWVINAFNRRYVVPRVHHRANRRRHAAETHHRTIDRQRFQSQHHDQHGRRRRSRRVLLVHASGPRQHHRHRLAGEHAGLRRMP